MPFDYLKHAEENMRRIQEHGGGIDRSVDHYVKTAQTQAAIIGYIKDMAEVMAAAAIASQKAVGDSPDYAINKWTRILADEAKRLVRDKQAQKPDAPKQLDSGTVIESDAGDDVLGEKP